MSYLMAFREKLVVVEVERESGGLGGGGRGVDTECAQPSLLCCVRRSCSGAAWVRLRLRNSLFLLLLPPPPPADTKPCPDKSHPPPVNLRTGLRGPQTGGERDTSGHPALRELKSLVTNPRESLAGRFCFYFYFSLKPA